METNWLVTAEHDQQVFERLGKALRELGYDLTSERWGLGGSQELSEWVVVSPEGSLQILAETYIGLTVSGRVELVWDLKRQYSLAAAR